MVDASEFVDGVDVDVQRLAGTVIGGVLVAWWASVMAFYEELAHWLQRAVTSPIDVLTELFVQLSRIPANVLEAAWHSAAAFLEGIGAVLGPFAYVAALAIVFATVWVLDWALENMEVI